MSKKSKLASEIITRVVNSNTVAVFTFSYCKICDRLKNFLKENNIVFYNFDIDEHNLFSQLLKELTRKSGQKAAPFVFIRKTFFGNFVTLLGMYHCGTLMDYIKGVTIANFDYEVIVVGGGCAGLAAAKEAAKSGKTVGLFDICHRKTSNSYEWNGLGGTCTNTGSVPTKLVYHAATIGDLCEDGKYFGWNFEFNKQQNHDWPEMMKNINDYIKNVSSGFKRYYSSIKVRVFFAQVLRFIDRNTIEAIDKSERRATFRAQVFVIASGGLPKVPDIPGAECAITSDDLFSLPKKPGKTLVVGAGCVAMECAGFLNALGVDCTVFVRSTQLSKCDSQIADMISSHMKSLGIKFINATDLQIIDRNTEYKKEEENMSKTKKVRQAEAVFREPQTFTRKDYNYRIIVNDENGMWYGSGIESYYFDLILLAVGRQYDVTDMGLDSLGVQFNSENGKIRVNKYDRTACPTIFAIGDVADQRPELAPVAMKAGTLLGKRMIGSEEIVNYDFIPSALFTPLEYGFCGYSEKKAAEIYGEMNLEIYQNRFQPLAWAMQQRNQNRCYMKIICLKSDNCRVIGIHILGPNAAEIIQGFAFALRLNLNKSIFDHIIAVHPTCAEELMNMEYRKQSVKQQIVSSITSFVKI